MYKLVIFQSHMKLVLQNSMEEDWPCIHEIEEGICLHRVTSRLVLCFRVTLYLTYFIMHLSSSEALKFLLYFLYSVNNSHCLLHTCAEFYNETFVLKSFKHVSRKRKSESLIYKVTIHILSF